MIGIVEVWAGNGLVQVTLWHNFGTKLSEVAVAWNGWNNSQFLYPEEWAEDVEPPETLC